MYFIRGFMAGLSRIISPDAGIISEIKCYEGNSGTSPFHMLIPA
jgi:hypothetical protein